MKIKTTFRSCGLNPEHNFLRESVEETEFDALLLKNEKDLMKFSYVALYTEDCDYCAIFVIRDAHRVDVIVKIDEDIKNVYKENCDVYAEIADMQQNLKFSRYALLEQVDDEVYTIIMD